MEQGEVAGGIYGSVSGEAEKGRMAVIQGDRKYFALMGLSRVGVRGLASL